MCHRCASYKKAPTDFVKLLFQFITHFIEEETMAQKVEISVKNVQLSDQLKEYVNKKIARLERILPELEETKVDLVSSKSLRLKNDREIAQFTLMGKGFILRTEERDSELMTAIDKSADKMQRQVERFKGKRTHGRGNGASAAEVMPEEVTSDEPKTVIVRRKSFTLVPMDESEAIEQMALLAHEDFFIFFNVNTNSINVLYKRRDGDYGLIQPKLG
jgi:putative sigma-54 modulation protein